MKITRYDKSGAIILASLAVTAFAVGLYFYIAKRQHTLEQYQPEEAQSNIE